MFALIASIACSVAVSVVLKLFRRAGVQAAQAVLVNYAVALALVAAVLQPTWVLPTSGTAWGVLLALGVLLPSVFLAMASAANQAGIVRSDAAQRLSLILPLLASFTLFGQALQGQTLAGIGLALVALGCLLWRRPDRPGQSLGEGWQALLAVWLGYGVIDILFKQLARAGSAFGTSLGLAFLLAGLGLGAWLLLRRTVWSARSLAAGVLLGVLNFGNIVFYIRAHQQFPETPAVVFSAMNLGVVALGTIVGAVGFREKPGWIPMLGIALTLLAILLLMP